MLGLLHFVFGLEMTLNSLRRAPLEKRSRYTSLINLTITLLLYAAILTVTLIKGKADKKCFATISFVAASLHLNRLAIAFISVMIPFFLAMAAIISIQLLRTIQVEPNERVAGSRMVYYLLFSAAQYVWFITQSDDLG